MELFTGFVRGCLISTLLDDVCWLAVGLLCSSAIFSLIIQLNCVQQISKPNFIVDRNCFKCVHDDSFGRFEEEVCFPGDVCMFSPKTHKLRSIRSSGSWTPMAPLGQRSNGSAAFFGGKRFDYPVLMSYRLEG